MAGLNITPPKVFISYSHDSPEHADRVRELSDRLRAEGIDCNLDQYEASPSEGWPRWMEKQIDDADFVLVVCTETYLRRVKGTEKPGTGLGVRWESHLTYQQLYNEGAVNTKFIPVLFESGEFKHIPQPLQGFTFYRANLEEDYQKLYRHLTGQPLHPRPELGRRRELAPAPKLQPLEPKERKQNFFANLPFERNPFFTGREEILKNLHVSLAQTSATALSQAISGLGGIGKTQTALEYAYRFSSEYNYIFWVRADSHLSLSTGFVDIARLLNLPEKDAQNPDDTARAVLRWLEQNTGWLLIFDNADDPELLKPFRPRNPQGHILLTSRAQVFDTVGIAKPIEMEVMLPDDALKFLFTRTGRDDDDIDEHKAAEQLAETLGYLPLALEQAGAFIIAQKARFQDYLISYNKRHLNLLQEYRPIAGDYPESVATTWAMNFSEVEKLSEASSDLLRLSAFLSPDNIPLELITKGQTQLGPALSAALVDVDDDPLLLNKVLEPLTRYSLIRLDSDTQTYNIHRLVQEVLKDGMNTNARGHWAEHSISALNQAFPYVEFKNWPLCERLLPHAKAASKLIEDWDITFEEARHLLNKAAVFCYERGAYANAAGLLAQCLAIAEKKLEPNHPHIAMQLNNLAEIYRVIGKYDEAEVLLKRCLAIREKILGPSHQNTAQSLQNLALLYYTQEKYDAAEPLYMRAVSILENALGKNHLSVVQSLNNLAALYFAQDKYTEAESLHKRCLATREKELGQAHPAVAISLHNLATVYRVQSRYDEAEPLYQRALLILEKALGLEHPDVATVLENYAILLRDTNRAVEAAEMQAHAKEILAKHKQENSGE